MIAPVVTPSRTDLEQNRRRFFFVRIACWTTALVLGALQAWTTRFSMNPDGISYLDIGDAYWRHDWHNAINAYWSPMYSWILGFFINTIRPSPYWEYPLVHLVNFLIYIGALGCFEYFLLGFAAQRARPFGNADRKEILISKCGWWMLGYSVFASSSLLLISLMLVTPDLCVAAVMFVAFGLLIRTPMNKDATTNFALLGAILGLGYFVKAVIFVLSPVFFLAALLSSGYNWDNFRRMLCGFTVFLLLCAPFIALISFQKERLTFGDSGKITYSIFLDKAAIFTPKGPSLRHPPAAISNQPLAHEFRAPISGSYPLWYDPSYWHEGTRLHFDAKSEIGIMGIAAVTYLVIAGSVFKQLGLTVGLFLLFVVAPRPSICFRSPIRHWRLLLPVAAAIAAYACVYTEARYVAPFLVVGWITAFDGVRLPESSGMKKFMSIVISGMALITAITLMVGLTGLGLRHSDYIQAADELRAMNIAKGEKLAVIAKQPFDSGGAFVARLARLQIVAETTYPEQAFRDKQKEFQLLRAFAHAGARFALTDDNVRTPQPCWERLANTRYSLCDLSLITGSVSTDTAQ